MNARALFPAGLIGLGLALAFSAPSALAENSGDAGKAGSPNHQGYRGQRMVEELNLTPDQQKQFQTIQKNSRAQMKTLHESNEKQVLAVLNPDQATKYKAYQSQRRDAMRNGGPGGGGGWNGSNRGNSAMSWMKANLNLSSSQEKQIQSIQSKNEAKMKSMMDSNRKQMTAILTPEQKAKFESHMKSRPNGGGKPQ